MMDYGNVMISCRPVMCDPEKTKEWLEDKAVTMHGDFAAYYTVNLSENKDGIAFCFRDQSTFRGVGRLMSDTPSGCDGIG